MWRIEVNPNSSVFWDFLMSHKGKWVFNFINFITGELKWSVMSLLLAFLQMVGVSFLVYYNTQTTILKSPVFMN